MASRPRRQGLSKQCAFYGKLASASTDPPTKSWRPELEPAAVIRPVRRSFRQSCQDFAAGDHQGQPSRRGKGVQFEGAGLGLAIVNEIMNTHGGRVSVENRSPDGSIFALHFATIIPKSSGCRRRPRLHPEPISNSTTSISQASTPMSK